MSFLIDGIRALDPKPIYDYSVRRGLPTAHWLGQANVFTNSLGGAPATGKLLLSLDAIQQLDVGDGDASHQLQILGAHGETPITIASVYIIGHCEVCSPGAEEDEVSAYVVEVADRRFHEYHRGEPHTKAYNFRNDAGAYIDDTTQDGAGTAWTWAQIMTDLWPSSLGTAPSLPFTPHGTPEGLWFYHLNPLQAVDYFLTRIACALKYDPVGNTFTIERLGLTTATSATQFGTLTALHRGALIYDNHQISGRIASFPHKVRVEFRVKEPYDDGTLSYYESNYTITAVTNPTANANTYVFLQDDLYAQYNGTSITNTATLEARRDERGTDYVRKRQYHDTGRLMTYSGAIDMTALLGAYMSACSWEDRGRGLVTTISSPRNTSPAGRSLELWERFDSVDITTEVCVV
jgi:hypothetical protein